MAGFYVRRGEKVVGPFKASDLRSFLAAGKISAEDQIAKDPAGPWHLIAKTNIAEKPPAQVPAVIRSPAVGEIATIPQTVEQPRKSLPVRVVTSVRTGVLAVYRSTAQTLAVKSQRRHELKLARIQAETEKARIAATIAAESPPAAPSVTTIVNVRNVNNSGGCGCFSAFLLLVIIGIAAFIYVALTSPP